ncbi:MAG: flagellar basal body P-ring protein FlgI [Bdellovibrionales bacterium]|jgi:flagellar P-ring protein FlgI|nr:flagellar basal body P-ring protein FlgI [Bdellovibrionales bacterium]
MKIIFFILMLIPQIALSSKVPQRLKDIISIKDVRSNPIIGYGVVIGLNGTGDSSGDLINNSMKQLFMKLGLNPKNEVASKNVASVIVTAKLPPFARIGQKIDAKVSSIGNASSLAGGTLLITPLKGGDGKIYGIANGSVSIGGLTKGKKFPTIALLPSGVVVEKEIKNDFNNKKSVRFSLNNSDFTTAARIEQIINQELGGKFASAKDSTTIDLMIPIMYQRNIVKLMAIIENFKVYTDQKAKIIINERTGTIVAGGDVMIKEVAIGHGDLTIEVGKKSKKDNKKSTIYHMEEGTNLKDLAKGLNAFGVTPEDIISILQALKRNGALIGEIEVI